MYVLNGRERVDVLPIYQTNVSGYRIQYYQSAKAGPLGPLALYYITALGNGSVRSTIQWSVCGGNTCANDQWLSIITISFYTSSQTRNSPTFSLYLFLPFQTPRLLGSSMLMHQCLMKPLIRFSKAWWVVPPNC